MVERIDPATASVSEMEQHWERYAWAAEHTLPGETVLDAACGTGYGRAFFEPWAYWIGVDRVPVQGVVASVDLCSWTAWQWLRYDVFVGLETIEHLQDPTNYVAMAKAARRVIVLSTPMIVTVGVNEFHLRDYSPAEIVSMFSDEHWQLQEYREQAQTYGWSAFRRTG